MPSCPNGEVGDCKPSYVGSIPTQGSRLEKYMERRVTRVCQKHGETLYKLDNPKVEKYRCCKCSTEAVQRRRLKVKKLCIEYKGGKCQQCGYDKCDAALEFHHMDPTQKDFGIASRGHTRSFERIKIELDKCIMLCANCHREEHVRLKIEE